MLALDSGLQFTKNVEGTFKQQLTQLTEITFLTKVDAI
jgi:hypothetical protein